MGGLISYGVTSSELVGGRSTVSSLSLRPSADVFVTDRWTIGASVVASRLTSDTLYPAADGTPFAVEQSGYALSVAPRLGRTVDLGPVTLWPKLGVGYGLGRIQQGATRFEQASWSIARTVSGTLALDVVFPLSKPPRRGGLTSAGRHDGGRSWRAQFRIFLPITPLLPSIFLTASSTAEFMKKHAE